MQLIFITYVAFRLTELLMSEMQKTKQQQQQRQGSPTSLKR